MYISKQKFDKLSKESKADISNVVKADFKKGAKKITEKEIDSIKKEVKNKLDKSFIPLPEATKKQIINEVEKEVKDTTALNLGNGNRISFGADSRLDKFVAFQKKNPDIEIDPALDSLGYEKTFTNRFLYTRAEVATSLFKKEEREKYKSDLLSYGSVSLFIFLPFFTLFLKFFYIRRRYTYVDHLIFVFHTQTVFFMLLTILYLISFFTKVEQAWIFIALFLLYLIIAMKKFYQQGYIKTFIKFCLLNMVYLFLGFIGIAFVFLISFALY